MKETNCFYKDEIARYAENCLILPKALLTDQRYKHLRSSAKTLFALLLSIVYAKTKSTASGKFRVVEIDSREIIKFSNISNYKYKKGISDLTACGLVKIGTISKKKTRLYISEAFTN